MKYNHYTEIRNIIEPFLNTEFDITRFRDKYDIAIIPEFISRILADVTSNYKTIQILKDYYFAPNKIIYNIVIITEETKDINSMFILNIQDLFESSRIENCSNLTINRIFYTKDNLEITEPCDLNLYKNNNALTTLFDELITLDNDEIYDVGLKTHQYYAAMNIKKRKLKCKEPFTKMYNFIEEDDDIYYTLRNIQPLTREEYISLSIDYETRQKQLKQLLMNKEPRLIL